MCICVFSPLTGCVCLCYGPLVGRSRWWRTVFDEVLYIAWSVDLDWLLCLLYLSIAEYSFRSGSKNKLSNFGYTDCEIPGKCLQKIDVTKQINIGHCSWWMSSYFCWRIWADTSVQLIYRCISRENKSSSSSNFPLGPPSVSQLIVSFNEPAHGVRLALISCCIIAQPSWITLCFHKDSLQTSQKPLFICICHAGGGL